LPAPVAPLEDISIVVVDFFLPADL
jgi:hypothetical protein